MGITGHSQSHTLRLKSKTQNETIWKNVQQPGKMEGEK